MTSIARIKNTLSVTLVATLLSACSGNSVDNPPGSGGTSQTGNSSPQAGMPGSGGSAQGGTGGTGTAGSGGMTCGPGCINLCEGGLCDCYCSETCEDFRAPPYDKSCTTDDDCFAGVHTSDCCRLQHRRARSIHDLRSRLHISSLVPLRCRRAHARIRPDHGGSRATRRHLQRRAVPRLGAREHGRPLIRASAKSGSRRAR
jgi:hypothetical protein